MTMISHIGTSVHYSSSGSVYVMLKPSSADRPANGSRAREIKEVHSLRDSMNITVSAFVIVLHTLVYSRPTHTPHLCLLCYERVFRRANNSRVFRPFLNGINGSFTNSDDVNLIRVYTTLLIVIYLTSILYQFLRRKLSAYDFLHTFLMTVMCTFIFPPLLFYFGYVIYTRQRAYFHIYYRIIYWLIMFILVLSLFWYFAWCIISDVFKIFVTISQLNGNNGEFTNGDDMARVQRRRADPNETCDICMETWGVLAGRHIQGDGIHRRCGQCLFKACVTCFEQCRRREQCPLCRTVGWYRMVFRGAAAPFHPNHIPDPEVIPDLVLIPPEVVPPAFDEVLPLLGDDAPQVIHDAEVPEVIQPILPVPQEEEDDIRAPLLYHITGPMGLYMNSIKLFFILLNGFIQMLHKMRLIADHEGVLNRFIGILEQEYFDSPLLRLDSEITDGPYTNVTHFQPVLRTYDAWFYTLYNQSEYNAYRHVRISRRMYQLLERSFPMPRSTDFLIPRMMDRIVREDYAWYTETVAFNTASVYYQRMRWRNVERGMVQGVTPVTVPN